MNIKSLQLKNIIQNEFGDIYFDLNAPSFVFNPNYGIKAVHYVTAEQACRIDLISIKYYGSTSYIDALCIVNNIFNPFSVNEGDFLVIPDLSNDAAFYKKPSRETRRNPLTRVTNDTSRKSQRDSNRVIRLMEKAKKRKNGVKNPIPSNILQPNQNSKTLGNGRIQLGSNLNSI